MAVFYSFHYDRDSWRVQQVMNMGVVEGQPLLNSQDWEAVKRRGDQAIENWIEEQMKYKTAVVVLVGAETDTRKWVLYEIAKAWNDKRPMVGIRIHGLLDSSKQSARAGGNPFEKVNLQGGGNVGQFVSLHSPVGADSSAVYANIKQNLQAWINSAYRRQ